MWEIAFEVLKWAWPFIREIVFGDKDAWSVIKKNWLTIILFLGNVAMFALFFIMSQQAWNMAKEVRKNQTTISNLTAQVKKLVPTGIDGPDTAIAIGQKMSKLNDDLETCKGQLTVAYVHIGELTTTDTTPSAKHHRQH